MPITLKKVLIQRTCIHVVYDKLYSIQIMYHLFVPFVNQWSIFLIVCKAKCLDQAKLPPAAIGAVAAKNFWLNHLGGRKNFGCCSPVVSLGAAEDMAQQLGSGAVLGQTASGGTYLAAAFVGCVLFTSITLHTAGPCHV